MPAIDQPVLQTAPRQLSEVLRALQRKDLRGAVLRIRSALDEPGSSPVERSVLLHLGAIACYALGQAAAGGSWLEQASRIEGEQLDCAVGSQHTIHQLSLLNQNGVSVSAIKRYYLQTLKTLRSSANSVGMGLCLRSLGEIALAAGALTEARTCWRRSRQLLAASAAAEADQLDAWLGLLDSFNGAEVEQRGSDSTA